MTAASSGPILPFIRKTETPLSLSTYRQSGLDLGTGLSHSGPAFPELRIPTRSCLIKQIEQSVDNRDNGAVCSGPWEPRATTGLDWAGDRAAGGGGVGA